MLLNTVHVSLHKDSTGHYTRVTTHSTRGTWCRAATVSSPLPRVPHPDTTPEKTLSSEIVMTDERRKRDTEKTGVVS